MNRQCIEWRFPRHHDSARLTAFIGLIPGWAYSEIGVRVARGRWINFQVTYNRPSHDWWPSAERMPGVTGYHVGPFSLWM